VTQGYSREALTVKILFKKKIGTKEENKYLQLKASNS
jgi:hypothetical protein